MRCIETSRPPEINLKIVMINSNMRCIETYTSKKKRTENSGLIVT